MKATRTAEMTTVKHQAAGRERMRILSWMREMAVEGKTTIDTTSWLTWLLGQEEERAREDHLKDQEAARERRSGCESRRKAVSQKEPRRRLQADPRDRDWRTTTTATAEIGRASCRERV